MEIVDWNGRIVDGIAAVLPGQLLRDVTEFRHDQPGQRQAHGRLAVRHPELLEDGGHVRTHGHLPDEQPGGDARQLYRSVRRLMELPDETRVFLCHDYKAPNRDEFVWETTILAERTSNVHLHDGVSEEEFAEMRTRRDATLEMPRLILPSIQVNMRAGQLPPADDNGVSYLRIPVKIASDGPRRPAANESATCMG